MFIFDCGMLQRWETAGVGTSWETQELKQGVLMARTRNEAVGPERRTEAEKYVCVNITLN